MANTDADPGGDADYGFLRAREDAGEQVAIHLEASSYDQANADLRTVAAIRIRGCRILTSQQLILSFWPTEPAEPALSRLLSYIGGRTLVGYYLDFTVGVLDRYVQPMIGAPLPNPRVDISSVYYQRKLKTPSKHPVDLRLDSIVRDLDLPARTANDAYSNALAAALVHLRLCPPEGR